LKTQEEIPTFDNLQVNLDQGSFDKPETTKEEGIGGDLEAKLIYIQEQGNEEEEQEELKKQKEE
jgi:hypothetical protein